MIFVSKNLNRLVNLDKDPNQMVDLALTARKIIGILGDHTLSAKKLLTIRNRKITRGELGMHLFDAAKFDSVVRDVNTTGHLAKVISRLELFKKLADPRIFGMPNKLFDSLSQAERAEFFRRGNILEIDGDLLDLQEIRAMMDHEAEIFKRFN